MSQSLSSRAMSFEQGDVFRLNINQALNVLNLPQSLSSRAMSFDLKNFYLINLGEQVSIPFEQGDVFRLLFMAIVPKLSTSLNPFRAGRCLSTGSMVLSLLFVNSLNPFRAGRCLSTLSLLWRFIMSISLNPFRAGRCLSTEAEMSKDINETESQSLSSRAMSFDRGNHHVFI